MISVLALWNKATELLLPLLLIMQFLPFLLLPSHSINFGWLFFQINCFTHTHTYRRRERTRERLYEYVHMGTNDIWIFGRVEKQSSNDVIIEDIRISSYSITSSIVRVMLDFSMSISIASAAHRQRKKRTAQLGMRAKSLSVRVCFSLCLVNDLIDHHRLHIEMSESIDLFISKHHDNNDDKAKK